MNRNEEVVKEIKLKIWIINSSNDKTACRLIEEIWKNNNVININIKKMFDLKFKLAEWKVSGWKT